MNKLWKFCRDIYRWDHETFDEHFDLCLFLTNEHIFYSNLKDVDKQFYMKLLEKRKKELNNKKEKRKQQVEKYTQKKKRKD